MLYTHGEVLDVLVGVILRVLGLQPPRQVGRGAGGRQRVVWHKENN